MKSEGFHSKLSCEGCHGAGYKHVENPKDEKLVKPDSREFCSNCHSINLARGKDAVTQKELKEHNTGEKCITCHNPHQP
jgi:hypothetical protein